MKVKLNKMLIIILIAAAVCVGAASSLWMIYGKDEVVLDLSGKEPNEIAEILASDDFANLSREQRRDTMQQMMDTRIEEYFSLPAEEQTAYLDKSIDEMQAVRSAFRAGGGMRRFGSDGGRDRQERNQTAEAGGQRQGSPDRARMRRGWWRNPEMRRARREFRDPRRRAQRIKFFRAMRERMRERGMDFGFRGRRR